MRFVVRVAPVLGRSCCRLPPGSSSLRKRLACPLLSSSSIAHSSRPTARTDAPTQRFIWRLSWRLSRAAGQRCSSARPAGAARLPRRRTASNGRLLGHAAPRPHAPPGTCASMTVLGALAVPASRAGPSTRPVARSCIAGLKSGIGSGVCARRRPAPPHSAPSHSPLPGHSRRCKPTTWPGCRTAMAQSPDFSIRQWAKRAVLSESTASKWRVLDYQQQLDGEGATRVELVR